MSGGIPSDVVGVFVGVLIYSILCFTLCLLLTCLLISFGEKWTYVTLLSIVTALSTLASIIQQIHFAINWEEIKKAQFEKAIEGLVDKGLSIGGAAHPVDVVLFFIQFWCYNTMALNILFWAVALFNGSWGIRASWLGNWHGRIVVFSKWFTILFPSVIIGLLSSKLVRQSFVATFIVACFTMFISLTAGSVLLVLILYKYMRTRRLAAGHSRNGHWWASDDSKSQQSGDVGSHYIQGASGLSSTRRSIYDRALVTRFTVGFVILALFEVAIIAFSLVQTSMNGAIAMAGAPDFSIRTATIEIVLFIPGPTTSLVAFFVFGTTKSWRQYRDLITGGCGMRKRLHNRQLRKDEEANASQGEEFERLSSLRKTASGEERKLGEETKTRVRMFAREIRGSFDESVNSPSGRDHEPARGMPTMQQDQSNVDVFELWPVRDGAYASESNLVEAQSEDLVIQYSETSPEPKRWGARDERYFNETRIRDESSKWHN